MSGATVVDNARTFRHKLFRWPDHLERFRRDCRTCYVPLEATDDQLTATAEELVAHNAAQLPPGGELQLVTFATPGPLGFYLGVDFQITGVNMLPDACWRERLKRGQNPGDIRAVRQ